MSCPHQKILSCASCVKDELKKSIAEERQKIKEYQFHNLFSEDLSLRMTGRTTRIAIDSINKAFSNPKKSIIVKDHFTTHEASLHLLSLIKEIVHKLDLSKYFKFDKYRLTIKYIGDSNE